MPSPGFLAPELEAVHVSHVVELTDEQYDILKRVAARDQETPEQLIGRMVKALTDTQGTIYFTDEELLRALGADDAELEELARLETLDHADE
jgi:predicted thioredoxin/glutaredoxin